MPNLGVVAKISDIQSQKQSGRELSVNFDDLFIAFGKYIYLKQGFTVFRKYYNDTCEFKIQLVFLLLQYYKVLDLSDTDKINGMLMKIVNLVNNYHASLLDFTDEDFSSKFATYFTKNKNNLSQLDHRENGELVVSQIQVEWTIRIKNLENYYNKIYNSFTEPENDSSSKKGWISRGITWWYGGKSQSKAQLCIENEPSSGEDLVEVELEEEEEEDDYETAPEFLDEEHFETGCEKKYIEWNRFQDFEYCENYDYLLENPRY